MITVRELRHRLFKRDNQDTILMVTLKPHSKSRKMTVRELREYLIEHYNIDSECKVKYIG